jgi:hypothetical protein
MPFFQGRAMSNIIRRLAAYAQAEDPLVAASNVVALVVAFNQPFYPLYIRWLVGDDQGASLVTFISTPFFLAVPAVTRLSSLVGRAMLPLTGILNTLISAQWFGAASGVELFLCPCAMIAGMSMRQEERATMAAIVVLALVGFALLHGRALGASERARSFHRASMRTLSRSTCGALPDS